MSMLLFAALLAAATAAPNEIDDAAFHIVAPHPFSAPLTEPAETPWGRATMSQWVALYPAGVTYVFSSFAFRFSRPLATSHLRAARAYFLRNRKCIAEDVRAAPMLSGDGVVWPQTVFAGNCAAGETFREVTLIADGRLYQLQAMSSISSAPPAPANPATSASEPRTLAEALAGFVRQCRFRPAH
jgi:hypothetical protein